MTTELNEPDNLEMPAPTLWPPVLAAALTLMAAGFVTSWLFTLIGAALVILALANWIMLLVPGRGTHLEEREGERPQSVREHLGAVERLQPGMAGHRMRIPEKVHPYSAGAIGGLIGGAAMTIPALLYGWMVKGSVWYPINLLVGMVVPLKRLPDGHLDIADLEKFHPGMFVIASFIHICLSLALGLMYGVLLPMLPGRPLFFGGILAPLLWTGAAYGFMGVLNPDLAEVVEWPSFIISQFVFGVVVGLYVVRTEKVHAEEAGTFGPRRARPTMTPPPGEGNP